MMALLKFYMISFKGWHEKHLEDKNMLQEFFIGDYPLGWDNILMTRTQVMAINESGYSVAGR